MTKFPIHPKNPERICWGCDKFCPADDLCCGNGTIRAPHPIELFGVDWWEWAERQGHSEAESAADTKAQPDIEGTGPSTSATVGAEGRLFSSVSSDSPR